MKDGPKEVASSFCMKLHPMIAILQSGTNSGEADLMPSSCGLSIGGEWVADFHNSHLRGLTELNDNLRGLRAELDTVANRIFN